MTEQANESAQTPASGDQIAQIIKLIRDEAPELQGLVVGFVRKDGNAFVRSTPMPPPMLGHVSRILELKVDRAYMASMQQAPVTRPGTVVQSVKTALANAAAKGSPAQRLTERDKERNKRRAAKKG